MYFFVVVFDKIQRDQNEEGYRAASTSSGVLSRADELFPRWTENDRTLWRVRGGLECSTAEDKTATGRREEETS